MCTRLTYGLSRIVGYSLLLFICLVTNQVKAADAVICTTTSDGQISSLMGTDFDPDPKKNVTGSTYSMGQMFKNTPKGIMIFPDELATTQYCNSYSGTLHSYDGDVNHYDYDWLKANNAFDKYGKYYIVTDSLHKMFPKGRGLPFGYKDGTNSFYVTSANPQGSLCGIWFPWDLFRGRKFTLSYRFYIIEADSTKLGDTGSNYTPSFGVGGHNSSGGYSGVTIRIKPDYDDEQTVGGGNGINLLEGAGNYMGNASIGKPASLTYFKNNYWVHTFPCPWDKNTTFQHIMPRVDMGYTITYDIDFVNYGTGSFDCLLYYPYLNANTANQWRIVIDYINVAMEHLCVDKDSVCPGKEFNVHAIDYPADAVLEWQYCVNGDGNWKTFNTTTFSEQSTVPFTVPSTASFLTQYTFRTHQIGGTYNNDKSVTGGNSLELTVTVASAAQCTPADPELKVNDMCATKAGTAQNVSITNVNDAADYTWKLIDPAGTDVTQKFLSFNETADPSHTSAVINVNESAVEGQYTLKVIGRNGVLTEASSKEMTYNFNVYITPRFGLNFYDEDGNKMTGDLCPSTLKKLKYIAKAEVSNGADFSDYKFTWTGANVVAGTPNEAVVDPGVNADGYCSGLVTSIKAAVDVDNNGCKNSWIKSYTVEKPTGPFVECDEIKDTTLYLAATAEDVAYTSAIPTATSQCGETPSIDIKVLDPSGVAIPYTLSADKKSFTATYPIGVSSFTITATDDCGNTESCSKNVTVKDTSKPNIDCDKLKNYNTKLSYYTGCKATPGVHESLPKLEIPELEDLDHPGTMIKATYGGRNGKTTVDLNADYEVGTTTITWLFADASGNVTTCTQTVTVINDKKPVVTCSLPDTTMILPTDAGVCGASTTTILSKIQSALGTTPIPTATDACNSSVTLSAKVFYKEQGAADWTALADGVTLDVDKVYTFTWRFYNNAGVSSDFVDGTSFDECQLNIKITDQENPVVNCVNTTPVIVSVNSTTTYSMWQTTVSYDNYASGAGSTSNKNYTLSGKFDNIPSATDACSGDLLPVVYLDSASTRILIGDYTTYSAAAAKAAIIKKLENTKFYANTTSFIEFVYTDEAGNKDSCTTQVTVVDRKAPVPDCWAVNSVDTVADANCKAAIDLFSFKNIPTATLNVTTQTTIPGMGMWGGSSTTSTSQDYTVYPVKIVREHYYVDANGIYVLDDTQTCENESKKTTVALTQKMTSAGWSYTTTVLTSTELQTTNYKSAPECLNTTFDLGKTVITLYYANGQGDTSTCVATVVVKDKTNPTITCGDFATAGAVTKALPADECSLSFDELGIKEATSPADLNASDNCTAADDLTLSFTRTHNGTKVADLKDTPYQIGTNVITWVVTDASGNESTCVNTIEVTDTTGPILDCSKIKPVTAYADKNCEATYDAVVKAGLTTPKAANDACSPVGTADSVEAVGTRSDGKALDAAYPKGETIITWTVKDAYDNVSTCTQTITVVDTTAPVFSDCGKLPVLTFYTEAGHCQVEADKVKEALGSHSATDNCGTTVDGVPGVGTNGADALPDSFAVGNTVVTWVFTDADGNSTYCEQIVTVKDTLSPVVDDVCPASVNTSAAEGDCSIDSPYPDDVVFNDNCDGALTGVFARDDDATLTNKDPFPVGVTNVTWTFTDKSGNSSVCKATVTVKDVTKPELYCNYSVNDSLIFTMTEDECGTASSKVVEQVQIPYAYDECDQARIDNYESQLWYIGLDGNSTPTLITDGSGKAIAWNDPTYTYQPGYTQLFFIFADTTGNVDTCKFTVFVRDNTPPLIDCNNITSPYKLNPAAGQCDIAWASIDLNELNSERAVDRCTGEEYDGIPVNQEEGNLYEPKLPTTLSGGDTLNLWWYYITVKGGMARCEQQVIVVDNQKPTPDCDAIAAKKITVTAEDDKCEIDGATVAGKLKPYPTASDNCGTVTGVPTRSDSLAIDAPYPTGTTIITWTFSDSNPENDVTCEQEVFVKGSIAPEIDCDTFKHYFDTIPECDTRALAIRTPYAVDVCAPESLKSVAGVPTRSDGAAITDPFPLGNTVVTWTFTDFTNSVSSSCTDTVNVRTEKKMDLNCTADVKVDAAVGECTKEVSVDQPIANHPCLAVTIPGVPYIGSQKIDVKEGKITYNFRTGVTKVMWIFTDTTNSLVKPVDTCYTSVQVGNTNEMPVDCNNFPEIKKTLVGKCSVDASEFGFSDPEVKDLCTGDVIVPQIYRTSDPTTKVDDANKVGTFKVGVQDTIVRLYIFQSVGQATADSMVCRQPVWLKDSLNIKTNCVPDDSVTTLMAEAEKCTLDRDSVLAQLGTPEATDECLDHSIPGVASLPDGSVLPKNFAVGDTITVMWTFHDELGNADSAFCFQKVTVISNQKPVFDKCDSLNATEIEFVADDACDYSFTDADFTAPTATDACTGKAYPAVGYIKSTGLPAIGSKVAVGYDTLVWVFTSPTSTASDTCEQPFVVRTNKEIDFDCSTLAPIVVSTKDCGVNYVDVPVVAPVAKNPCTNAEIVATTDFDTTAVLERNSTTTITWTFTDHSGTMKDSVKTCDQQIIIKNEREVPIDCSTQIRDTIVILPEGDCTIRTAALNLQVPNIVDTCSGETVIPTFSRSSGKALTDFWEVGTERLDWTFTIDDSISTTCPQNITIKDAKPEYDCNQLKDFEITIYSAGATIGSVLDTIAPVAVDPCTSTDIPGVATVDVAGKSVALSTVLTRGTTYHVTWTFFNETLNGDSTQCEQNITIGGQPVPGVHCEVYTAIDTVLDGACELSFAQLLIKIDTVIDEHPNGLVDDDPLTILPVIYRASDMDHKVDLNNGGTLDDLGKFSVGEDVIYYDYTVQGKTETCSQPVKIRSNNEPKFDCSTLGLINATAEDGKCEASLEAVLELLKPYPVASESCTDTQIEGVPSLTDGSALPSTFAVGDTVTVLWTFADPDHTTATKTCEQKVTVTSTAAPVFDCSSLDSLKFLAEGKCSVDLTEADIPTPVAKDSCTNTDVKAVGSRADGGELYGEYKVGYTTITWTFTSPYSTTPKTCEQTVYVRSDIEPDFDCSTLDSIKAVADGQCSLSKEDILKYIDPSPVATEHCTGTEVPGVVTLPNGDPLPDAFAVGDTVTIRWSFALPEFTTGVKTCDQVVTVTGNAAPKFDCSTLDTLHFTAQGECSIDLEPTDIPVPVATDGCSDDGAKIPGVGMRDDGGELDGVYNVGATYITWTFKSLTSSETKTCPQVVWVKTTKEIDAKCGAENYPEIDVAIADGSCSVDADSILSKLVKHSALNPCNDAVTIEGVATRSDGADLEVDYPMGTTTITWTFTDTTNTLETPVSTCEQLVVVGDKNKPVIDCPTTFPNATLYLDDENCDIDFKAIPVYLDSLPLNACSGERAVLDTTRSSGKAMTAPYGVGDETITWTFTFPTTKQQVVCTQNITVIDTVAPDFDCSTLADTIKVALTSAGNSVTYDEVVAAGFSVPQATDKCTEVTTTPSRADGKAIDDNYELGNTTVIFTFADIYGNKKTCSQIIKVEDMIPPVPTCPTLTNDHFACMGDTVAPYASYEEFKAAGGSIDDESKVDLSTFRSVTTIEGDECQATLTRDYYFTTVRGIDVHCEVPQTMYVKDSIRPVYVGIPEGGASINTSCDNPNDVPLTVTATDNCDPNPTVTYTRVSTQGGDPSQCDYYTYDITYTYTAVDRCGNTADPIAYTIHVKDTLAPIIHEPANWEDVMYPVYLKHCKFGIPDITALIPSDSIFQNCGDNQYLTYWQEPAAGDTIDTTTIVKLHILDVCGNDAVLEKTVAIQPRKEIIDITILQEPYLACGSDDGWLNPRSAANSLTSSDIKRVYGKVKVEDWDGTWGDEITNAVVDYYRDTVDFDHLVYSSPGSTYSDLFKNTEPKTEAGNLAFGNCVLLTRRTQSDTYFFVATDTVTGCTDTASVYIDVRERPRIALESGQWNICEGDSLTLQGEFGEAFAPCVDGMGSSIIAEGWMVNDSVYNPLDSVNYDEGAAHTAIYYATNECGTTTSLNSLYTSCAGDLESQADSMAYAGSAAKYAEMANDSLYVSDSVKINVYTHYDPLQVLLTTDPQDKARIWIGDEADLVATMPYEEPSVYKWMQVVGDFDGGRDAVYDKYGDIISNGSGENDDIELQYIWNTDDSAYYYQENTMTVMPTDSSRYYVVVGNGVCPTVSSNVASIDVLDKLPTAITPYTKDGMNDDFVRGHHVIIFNRYGQQVFEGNDGWDGTYRGLLADPGVYFYTVDMAGGVVLKGSIEVVKIE